MVRGQRSQTVLLSGPAGSGKTAWAEALAAAWLCKDLQDDGACGRCEACHYFSAETQPDFIELVPEKKGGQIPIEELRRRVHAEVNMAPQIGRRKVWLIAADALSEGGQNALLKVLEEPPPHAFFVLTSEERERLLPTLLSRAVCLAVPPLPRAALAELLEEQGAGSEEQRQLALTFARGLPGLALDIAKNEAFPELRRELWTWLKAFAGHNTAERLTEDYQFFESRRADLSDLLMFWQSFMRDLLLLNEENGEAHLMHRDMLPELRAFGKQCPLDSERAAAVVTILNETEQRLKANGNFEMNVCRMLLLTGEEIDYARNHRG